MEVYHLETEQPLQFDDISVIAHGPLRAAIAAKLQYNKSKIDITVCLGPPFIYYTLIHVQISLDAVAGKLGDLILILRILFRYDSNYERKLEVLLPI